ncbi:MAG: helix-turn-helix transcriptional regulator [Clostridia bacterium]|nr:helix-turn-helix transcriptional regulator [Clostridia bacterium]
MERDELNERDEASREMLLMGLRVKDVRVQFGLSLELFAARLGVSRSHLCNVECGRKQPSLEMLAKLASEFDVSMDYLVLGRQTPPQGGFLVFHSDEELLRILVLAPKGTREGEAQI